MTSNDQTFRHTMGFIITSQTVQILKKITLKSNQSFSQWLLLRVRMDRVRMDEKKTCMGMLDNASCTGRGNIIRGYHNLTRYKVLRHSIFKNSGIFQGNPRTKSTKSKTKTTYTKDKQYAQYTFKRPYNSCTQMRSYWNEDQSRNSCVLKGCAFTPAVLL